MSMSFDEVYLMFRDFLLQTQRAARLVRVYSKIFPGWYSILKGGTTVRLE